MRGLPSGVYSSRCTSSGSPSSPGRESRRGQQVVDAPSPARCVPSRGRSVSRSNTPSLVERRLLHGWPSARPGRARGPRARRRRAGCESRMCSRLCSGSASMPSSASRPDDRPSRCVRAARRCRRAARRRARERLQDRERQARCRCPACRWRRRRRRGDARCARASWSHSARPLRHGPRRLRGVLVDGQALARGLALVDPGAEVRTAAAPGR